MWDPPTWIETILGALGIIIAVGIVFWIVWPTEDDNDGS